jgi:hypothetical protein
MLPDEAIFLMCEKEKAEHRVCNPAAHDLSVAGKTTFKGYQLVSVLSALAACC